MYMHKSNTENKPLTNTKYMCTTL